MAKEDEAAHSPERIAGMSYARKAHHGYEVAQNDNPKDSSLAGFMTATTPAALAESAKIKANRNK